MKVILPEHILNKLSPKDREELSKAAGHQNAGRTAQECQQAYTDRAEKEIQKDISRLLAVSDIFPINPPMHRKSALPEGWPDFSFSYLPKGAPNGATGTPVALEVKKQGEKPRPEQNACHERMRRNGWHVHVVHDANDVKQIFRAMDAQHTINPLTGMPDPTAQQGGRL